MFHVAWIDAIYYFSAILAFAICFLLFALAAATTTLYYLSFLLLLSLMHFLLSQIIGKYLAAVF